MSKRSLSKKNSPSSFEAPSSAGLFSAAFEAEWLNLINNELNQFNMSTRHVSQTVKNKLGALLGQKTPQLPPPKVTLEEVQSLMRSRKENDFIAAKALQSKMSENGNAENLTVLELTKLFSIATKVLCRTGKIANLTRLDLDFPQPDTMPSIEYFDSKESIIGNAKITHITQQFASQPMPNQIPDHKIVCSSLSSISLPQDVRLQYSELKKEIGLPISKKSHRLQAQDYLNAPTWRLAYALQYLDNVTLGSPRKFFIVDGAKDLGAGLEFDFETHQAFVQHEIDTYNHIAGVPAWEITDAQNLRKKPTLNFFELTQLPCNDADKVVLYHDKTARTYLEYLEEQEAIKRILNS